MASKEILVFKAVAFGRQHGAPVVRCEVYARGTGTKLYTSIAVGTDNGRLTDAACAKVQALADRYIARSENYIDTTGFIFVNGRFTDPSQAS